jgi:hypothetical protein
MQKKHKLILDTFSGIYDQLKPYEDDWFWDFGEHQIVPGAVYVISQKEFKAHKSKIRDLVERNVIRVVLSNPMEGSETLITQCNILDIADLITAGKVLLVGGGDMDPTWSCLQYDYFLVKLFKDELGTELVDQVNAKAATHCDEIFSKSNKPYKFLFLNGRMRPHRKFLLEKFQLLGLLDQSIWSRLDQKDGGGSGGKINLWHNGENLIYTIRPVQYLPPQYEFDRYQDRVNQPAKLNFVKYELFDNQWGEMYLTHRPYVDTYFSVVTETVFTYPYSFRTEKLWKPIAMGHPFIVASNYGYYRDLHNLGFKTFGHLIDEGFDLIQNDQDRVERIAAVVDDLCQHDLDEFVAQCHKVCKYNQQHYHEMRTQVQTEFPNRFFQFINERY